MELAEALLSFRLSANYPAKPGVLDDVALEIRRAEILGLVGESGSGKSTLALALLKLLGLKGGVVKGEIRLEGRDLMALSERQMRAVRGNRIGLVLQSPLSSLNPALKIGTQLAEAWEAHAVGGRGECTRSILAALESVCLPYDEAFLRRYPSQVSVGQAQRVLIAMAVLHRPALLIADEPTSALDPITQSEILHLFAKLNRELGLAILYISHDLLSVATLCHRIAILHKGQIAECGPPQQIFRIPVHPYTRRLIAVLPRIQSRPSENAESESSSFLGEVVPLFDLKS